MMAAGQHRGAASIRAGKRQGAPISPRGGGGGGGGVLWACSRQARASPDLRSSARRSLARYQRPERRAPASSLHFLAVSAAMYLVAHGLDQIAAALCAGAATNTSTVWNLGRNPVVEILDQLGARNDAPRDHQIGDQRYSWEVSLTAVPSTTPALARCRA